MREIKFRLRDENTIVGYCLWLVEEGEYGKWIYSPDNELWNIGYPEIPHKEKDSYTGLKDKNGKEIYEGDIIDPHLKKGQTITIHTHSKDYVVVEFCAGYFGLRDLGNEAGYVTNVMSIEPDDWESYEVIGKIYENPELVKS